MMRLFSMMILAGLVLVGCQPAAMTGSATPNVSGSWTSEETDIEACGIPFEALTGGATPEFDLTLTQQAGTLTGSLVGNFGRGGNDRFEGTVETDGQITGAFRTAGKNPVTAVGTYKRLSDRIDLTLTYPIPIECDETDNDRIQIETTFAR